MRHLPVTTFLLLFLLAPAPASAQVDSAFIQLFDNRARINGGLRYRNREATFSTSRGEAFRLVNRGLAFRIGGRYRWIGYTFSFPLSDLGTSPTEEQGRSFGLGLRLYRPRYFFQTNFRNTKGFATSRPDGTEGFRPDVKLFTARLFSYYVLNHHRFSLRASFRQRERQLQNHGSLLLGGLIHRQVLTADSITIPLSSDELVDIARFSQTKLGIGGGYAYTWVLSPQFYVTPALIAGPEFRFISYDIIGNRRDRDRFRMSPRIRGHLALGLNGKRNFAALTIAYLPSLDVTDNLNTRIDHTEIELRVGRRL